jgi:cobalt/nickel transport protein
MRLTTRSALALALLGLLAPLAPAHFNMLLPQSAAAKKGEPVTLLYQWGHPFEHQLFDAPPPDSVFALGPDGKRTDLRPALEKTEVAGEDRKVTAYRLHFTPQQRGDFTFVLTTPPIWMGEEELFFQDTVRVVVHVQAQEGWDAATGQGFEMVPLTRPYGLEAGMAYQAQAAANGKPAAGVLVEVERYNPTPPKQLPPDEQITRTAKTDPNGVVTGTLTGPGWWCLTAQRDGGSREHDGKSYPVLSRSTLWVYVDAKDR